MGNLWGTLARVKGVKGGGVFHAHDTKRHGITRYPMPITQNDIALQGIPCPLHKTTLHYKVSHAHYTKRHRITRDSMPITQNDIELQGIPCPLHKTTPNYKVFRYRNCFGTETVSAPGAPSPGCFGTETVSVPKQPRVPPQHYWWTFRRNINGGGKSCVVSCNGHGIPCNPVSFYAMRMEYLVIQCRFVQWAQHTL